MIDRMGRKGLLSLLAGAALSVVLVSTRSDAAEPPIADRARDARGVSSGRLDRSGPRTLDEITIEGQVSVPQVLFIFSRPGPRVRDLTHRRYIRSAVEIGLGAPIPTGLLLVTRPSAVIPDLLP